MKKLTKIFFLSILIAIISGCAGKYMTATLEDVYVIIDSDSTWDVCKSEGCVIKIAANNSDYFWIYSIEDETILGHEVMHIIKYKNTGIWNEHHE